MLIGVAMLAVGEVLFGFGGAYCWTVTERKGSEIVLSLLHADNEDEDEDEACRSGDRYAAASVAGCVVSFNVDS